jgi:putative oxygen-independent coproporphyrinogen III oxidase
VTRIGPVGPPVALYVHVPFCVSLCPYCDFVVYSGAAARGPRSRVEAFLRAMRAEIDLRADALDHRFGRGRPPLETVYLGGGTPSLLQADAVAEVLARIGQRFGLAGDAEVTLEANPGPDERGDARAWRGAGVTRLSIGAQSLDDDELRRLGRRHRSTDVTSAVREARAAGLASVSLDLLYDVPGSTEASWAATLGAALKLDPDHLSLYALSLDDPDAEGLTGPTGDHLPTTTGARRWRTRARPAQDEDRAVAQYRYATDVLAVDGWRGYEISNWARPGHESRHNLVYWERRPYAAVGPGAHAFDGRTRRWNAARLDAYLAALIPEQGPPRLPPGGEEVLDRGTAAMEATMLALRTDRGVPLAATTRPSVAAAFVWAAANQLTEVTVDDRVVLTTRGRLMSNEVFVRLI